MARDLLLAIGIPLGLLMLMLLALEKGRLPDWLQRLSERPSQLWTIGVGLIIGLSLLRWLLQR